ncbi:ferredoxin [Amycolatopsis sp. K13G38]|uniref:Ferredoxin n=1 Tax=Amycolatopsis acididurans TaxID=2724524 RepID=A0ABX1J0Q3_9PSEU|nr:ferredoxin [Amycolatopsis acididurans]NKQ53204.1 ferredoxin [Amycolatopsis acididurans]
MTDVSVDRELCVGHGRCYAAAPGIFEPDDEGFAVVVGEATDDSRAALSLAEQNCPEHAVLVSEG